MEKIEDVYDHVAVITEFVPGLTLQDFAYQFNEILDEHFAREIIYKISKLVQSLQCDLKIVHRDLNPRSLVICFDSVGTRDDYIHDPVKFLN